MSISEFIQPLASFYANNKELSIAIAAAPVIAVIVKPKQIGKVLGAIAIIAVLGYVFMLLSDTLSTGIDRKNDAATRTDRQIYDKDQ